MYIHCLISNQRGLCAPVIQHWYSDHLKKKISLNFQKNTVSTDVDLGPEVWQSSFNYWLQVFICFILAIGADLYQYFVVYLTGIFLLVLLEFCKSPPLQKRS